jgi:hypothetical protein
MSMKKVTLENLKDFTDDQLLGSLPPRVIKFNPFNELYLLNIKTSYREDMSVIHSIVYEKANNTGMFQQTSSISQGRAARKLITRMLKKGEPIEFWVYEA